jgi:hypothetical protein
MHTRLRSFSALYAAAAFLFLVAGATTAAAQPPAAPAAVEAAPPPPNPAQMKWSSMAVVGFSKMTGPVETTNFTANGEVGAANDKRSVSLQADHSFGKYFGQTSADNQHVKLTMRQDIAKHAYLLARPSYERNKIQSIDYQYEELAGVGFWAGGARGRIDVAPVAGFIQQEKHIDTVDGNHFTYGGLQIATAQLTPLWTVSQSFVYMRNTGDLDDSRLQAGVSLSGVIKGPLALNVTYQAERDNIIIETAGGSKTTQTFIVGVQLQFPARP